MGSVEMTGNSSRFIIRQKLPKICNLLQTLKSYGTHKDTNLNLLCTGYL